MKSLVACFMPVVAFACSGKAIVDGPPGSGGSGGTSKATGAGAGTTSSSKSGGPMVTAANGSTAIVGVTTVGQTGPSFDACGFGCMAVNQCAMIGDCVSKCNNVNPTCANNHKTWLQCLANKGYGGCKSVKGCELEIDDYAACIGNCALGGCAQGSDGSCNCEAKCGGVLYSTQCSAAGGGQVACQCLVNGNFVGKCSGPTQNACDIKRSCCTPIFFVDG
jgi:hypothetical protein